MKTDLPTRRRVRRRRRPPSSSTREGCRCFLAEGAASTRATAPLLSPRRACASRASAAAAGAPPPLLRRRRRSPSRPLRRRPPRRGAAERRGARGRFASPPACRATPRGRPWAHPRWARRARAAQHQPPDCAACTTAPARRARSPSPTADRGHHAAPSPTARSRAAFCD